VTSGRNGSSPRARVASLAALASAAVLLVASAHGQEAVEREGDALGIALAPAPYEVPVEVDAHLPLELPRDVEGHVVRTGPRLRRLPDPEQPLGLDIAIEDRDGMSMAAFHRALRRAATGEGQARIVVYGASHVASDLFTGYIRDELQTRFGDAGHGFVLPVHPWRRYRHRGVEIQSSRDDWTPLRIRAGDRESDYFGLAGVTVETDVAGAFGVVRTSDRHELGSAAGRLELFYLQQPGGGSFDVIVDDRVVERVSTAADAPQAGYWTGHVPDGPHSLGVRVVGDGMVRLFGAVLERDRPGVIVDTLGINGARARYQLLWEDALYREHLARRHPDLVVLAYGTNEAGDDESMAHYEAQLREVVARVRETVPEAACLLVGPSDRPVRVDRRTYEDRPRTAALIEVQHRVATDLGCGFFDLVAFSGGPMSMVSWARSNPAFGQPDHVHYTRYGYHRLGEVLFGAMMEGFDGRREVLPAVEGDPATATALGLARSTGAGGG